MGLKDDDDDIRGDDNDDDDDGDHSKRMATGVSLTKSS